MTQTIDSIAQEIASHLDKGCIKLIVPPIARQRFLTAIRNNYNLWTTSPLTKEWRENPASRDIREGVDYSANHPDQVSAKVLDRVVEILEDKE